MPDSSENPFRTGEHVNCCAVPARAPRMSSRWRGSSGSGVWQPGAQPVKLPYNPPMCRNIQQLRGTEPPASEDEIRDAALQFVRKVSGYRKPSRANEAVFDTAVDEISSAVSRLLDGLVTARGTKPVQLRQRALPGAQATGKDETRLA